MNCKVCNNATKNIFSAILLNQYNVQYYYCEQCGFLQTEEPYWLEQAYKSPINIEDTGMLERSIMFSKLTAVIIYFLFNRYGKFLDYAGGYGTLTRLMRDLGFDFYWYDLHTPNLFARGFELGDKTERFDLITCFEAFEHFSEPIKDIEKMMQLSDNIFFTIELLPSPIPKPEEWRLYGLGHGQHISFYSYKTLDYIAQKYNMKLCFSGSVYLLTKNKHITNRKFNSLLRLWRIGLFRHILSRHVKNRMRSLMIDDSIYLSTKTRRLNKSNESTF